MYLTSYDIARNVDRTVAKEQVQRGRSCVQSSSKLVALDSRRRNSLIKSVTYPVSWALYKNRGEKA